MSKYLSGFDYECDSCSSCKNSLDPIDININVTCCPTECPEPSPNNEQCCCQQGIFEALNFLDQQNANIRLHGFRPGGGANLLGTGTITTLTEDIVVLSGNPTRTISLCAIWMIEVTLLPGGLTGAGCGTTNTNCCCNQGLRERLLTRVNIGETEISLDDANLNLNDTTGVVRLVCDDIVWIQRCVAGNTPPACTGDFIAIPLCRIAYFEPA